MKDELDATTILQIAPSVLYVQGLPYRHSGNYVARYVKHLDLVSSTSSMTFTKPWRHAGCWRLRAKRRHSAQDELIANVATSCVDATSFR